MLRRQDHDYFLDLLGPREFEAAVRFAVQHGENTYKVLKKAVKSVTRVGTSLGLRSRADRLTNIGGEDYTRQYQGAKRDREGNVVDIQPKKLEFDEPPIMSGGGYEFSRQKISVGRTRKRTANELFKAELGAMDEQVWRWQRVSDSLLGPGSTGISFGRDPTLPDPLAAGTYVLPYHVMSLTHNPSFRSLELLGCHQMGMCRYVIRKPMVPVEAFQGHIGYQKLEPQLETGAYSPLTSWQLEKGVAAASQSQVFHKWSDIRLNLYGSLLYPLEYTVSIVTGLPTEMQFFEHLPVSATVATAPTVGDFPISNLGPLNQMIVDKVRKYITNPIIGSNTDSNWQGKLKVIKKKIVKIPCLSYSNARDQTATGIAPFVDSVNVKSINMFIRHDRFRDYKWRTDAAYIQENDDVDGVGWTQSDIGAPGSSDAYCDVDREQRVFLVITCNCPTPILDATNKVDGVEFGAEVSQTVPRFYDGTYDIVVRNCFRSAEGD